MTRIGALALVVLAAVLLGLLLLFKQGDCGRSDDDDGGADDGMEPADTCKPGDQSCQVDEPAPPADAELRRADPGRY